MKKKKFKKKSAGSSRHSDVNRVEYEYHLPVLLRESVDILITNTNGIYIDGTLGGGGHSGEIVQRLDSGGRLFAFDKDPAAIEHCGKKFEHELGKGSSSRIVLINKCYSSACSIEEDLGEVNGLLLDLGVSSFQLDSNMHGIGYRVDTRLDMRFGTDGITAEDLLHAAKEEEIERILRDYGEEPFARAIARRIVDRRRAFALKSTFDLRSVVEETVPKHLLFKSLSRVFQAIRIAVNKELDVLQETITNTVPILKPGGRIVIISYHSLEDRIVKNCFRNFTRSRSGQSGHISKYSPTNETPEPSDTPYLKILTPKPVLPTEQELMTNPRARSAKMRAAERL